MYKNEFVSELPINEVKEYFDELRCNTPWTAEDSADFEICKERLVVYACKTLEQIDVLDKIKAEIMELDYDDYDRYEGAHISPMVCRDSVIEIIAKYRKRDKE